MFNERIYLKEIEDASTEELARLLLTKNAAEEQFLRLYFGPERYARMRVCATKQVVHNDFGNAGHGTVIILAGILGSELWEEREKIWMSVWNLIRGDFDQFSLNLDGTSVKNISSPSLYQKYYVDMQNTLTTEGWNTVVFPYDWRLDIAASARLLKEKIDTTVGEDEPLRFVAHSMGGLVVRSLLRQFPDLSGRLARFVMLGTPTFGSFAIPILYDGLNNVLKLIAIVDQQHFMDDLLAIAKTFVGTYQMQPFLGASPDAERLFDPATYGSLNPPAERFNAAMDFQTDLGQDLPLDPNLCNYIAGFNEETACGILDWNRLTSTDGYKMTLSGDGTVPHCLGLLPNLTTYYVQAKHADLPSNGQVIAAVGDLLLTGATDQLPTNMPAELHLSNSAMQLRKQQEQTRLEAKVADLRDRVILRRSIAPDEVSAAELELGNILTSGSDSSDAGPTNSRLYR